MKALSLFYSFRFSLISFLSLCRFPSHLFCFFTLVLFTGSKAIMPFTREKSTRPCFPLTDAEMCAIIAHTIIAHMSDDSTHFRTCLKRVDIQGITLPSRSDAQI